MAYSTLAGRLKRLIASLRRHGIRHVLEVLRQGRIRKAYAEHPPLLPERSAFSSLFPPTLLNGASGSPVGYLKTRAASLLMPWILGEDQYTDVRNNLRSFHGGASYQRDAELISSARFPGLGLCIADPSGRFNWHADYGSGKTWPSVPFNQIRFLESDGGDVKYPWELSRMYWIGWLGLAHIVENDAKPAEAFRLLLDDWQKENPFNTGVNWAMPMEVGIRGFWLMMGGGLFSNATSLTDEWWLDYYRFLWGHGLYLSRNLEYFPNLTNHYIANCFGLLVIGGLFLETKEGRRWFDEGKRRLSQELERQITRDGVHYERSISYHALVLEIYLIAIMVAERSGEPFDLEEIMQVKRMSSFLRHYLPPEGATVPQFGDSDDGVILRLSSDQKIYDHRNLLHFADALLQPDQVGKDGGSKKTREQSHEIIPLLFGLAKESAIAEQSSHLYREGGFAIICNQYWHLVADVGPIGLHGNNDTLAFTLHSSDGTSWLIDPGTGCYTRDPELRNLLRSTSAHNTPFIDSTEIAEFAGLWRVAADTTQTEVVESTLASASGKPGSPLILAARHHAYQHLKRGGVIMQRHWRLEGKELHVQDRITGSGNHAISISFTLPSEIVAQQHTDKSITLHRKDKRGPSLEFSCDYRMDLRESFYSPSYGLLLPSTRIEISLQGEAPLEITYLCRFRSPT